MFPFACLLSDGISSCRKVFHVLRALHCFCTFLLSNQKRWPMFKINPNRCKTFCVMIMMDHDSYNDNDNDNDSDNEDDTHNDSDSERESLLEWLLLPQNGRLQTLLSTRQKSSNDSHQQTLLGVACIPFPHCSCSDCASTLFHPMRRKANSRNNKLQYDSH